MHFTTFVNILPKLRYFEGRNKGGAATMMIESVHLFTYTDTYLIQWLNYCNQYSNN